MCASSGVGIRPSEHLWRDHPLGYVVEPLERAVATRRCHLTGEEQVLQRLLDLRPVPAPVDFRPGQVAVDVTSGDRATLLHVEQHPGDQLGLAGLDAARTAPSLGVGLGHPVLHVGPEIDRHVRRDVRPVLHQPPWPRARGALEQRHVVGTHPAEQRHEMGALENVDGVDLEDSGARDRAHQGAHRGGRVTRIEEALCSEGDPTCLRPSQRLPGSTGGDHQQMMSARSDIKGGRGASRARRTSRPPSGSAAAASPRCCARGS